MLLKFDLFEKDVVLMAVNHDNVHWTTAVINFRKKRIESYDSCGGSHQNVCDVSTFLQIPISILQ